MKEKSRLISQDGASQDHIRNIEAKLDQEKLGRQRAETQVDRFSRFVLFSLVKMLIS